MELVIPEKKKLKVTIYGQEYVVTRPTLSVMEVFMDGLDALDDMGKMKKSKDMISKLGIPMELLNELEVEHFTQLLEFLTGSLKKN